MSTFITKVGEGSDAYFELTQTGIFVSIILIFLLIVTVAMLKSAPVNEEGEVVPKKKIFNVKQLVFSAVSLALAFALSYVKIFRMPWGGSVTLCSMLFVTIIGYWYGPTIGLISAFAYGLLQFVQGGSSYMLSLNQVAMDYIVAFAALGLSGFFSRKKNGLLTGYLVGIFFRGLFHSIGGYLYWMDYMPENFPQSLAWIYPVAYNYAYIIAEGIITVIIISLPPVKKALTKVKEMALS